MNNEIQKFDFRGAALRTLTDEAGEPGSSPRTYATSSALTQIISVKLLMMTKSQTSAIRRFGISQVVRLSSSLSQACTSSSCARVSRRRRSSSVG